MEEVLYPLARLPAVEGPEKRPTEVIEVDRSNNVLRRERADLCQNFTEAYNPGREFREHYTQLHETLLEMSPATGVSGGGKFQVLRSFFAMMLELRRREREFVIVFRTFGTDLEVSADGTSGNTPPKPSCNPLAGCDS